MDFWFYLGVVFIITGIIILIMCLKNEVPVSGAAMGFVVVGAILAAMGTFTKAPEIDTIVTNDAAYSVSSGSAAEINHRSNRYVVTQYNTDGTKNEISIDENNVIYTIDEKGTKKWKE